MNTSQGGWILGRQHRKTHCPRGWAPGSKASGNSFCNQRKGQPNSESTSQAPPDPDLSGWPPRACHVLPHGPRLTRLRLPTTQQAIFAGKAATGSSAGRRWNGCRAEAQTESRAAHRGGRADSRCPVCVQAPWLPHRHDPFAGGAPHPGSRKHRNAPSKRAREIAHKGFPRRKVGVAPCEGIDNQ